MNIIAQEARFRQRVIKYSEKHGVTEASIRYKVSRMSLYRWIKRYNGKWWSLKEHSHRSKYHPSEQTEEEYNRCYQIMLSAIRRLSLDKVPYARKPRKSKPYQRVDYPGQKIQIDVKFVPGYCVSNGKNIINIRQ